MPPCNDTPATCMRFRFVQQTLQLSLNFDEGIARESLQSFLEVIQETIALALLLCSSTLQLKHQHARNLP